MNFNRSLTIVAVLCSVAFSAAAADCTQDHWACQDKLAHAGFSAIIAGATTAATGNEAVGVLVAAAVGAAKEGYDALHQPKHDPSWKDFGADVVGAVIGAKLGGLVIAPERRGLVVGFSRMF